jgi:secreted trypsin-like serine protease
MKVAAAVAVVYWSGSAEGFRQKKAKNATISIVNGAEADECEWKWQVGLVRKGAREGTTPYCGGMLIANKWVLTAAHCMQTALPKIVAGEHSIRARSGKEQYRNATRQFPHYLYNENTFDHDYALLELESPVDLTSCVGTIGLPEVDVSGGEECWITGWGTLSAGGRQPDVLQEAKVKILSNDDCKSTGYSASQITPAMICAQGRNADDSIADACQGDSGGPLVCKTGVDGAWAIDGATSWGRGCAGENYPGIWARVFNVKDWINDVMTGVPVPTKPPPPQCPSWSATIEPDQDGDCKCPGNKKCSVSEGSAWDCLASNGVGGFGGAYFLPTCEGCACF